MATGKIRVLRLLEYIYEDGEQASTDMQTWQVPAQGKKSVPKGPDHEVVVRSGILIAPFDPELDEDTITVLKAATGEPAVGIQIGEVGFPDMPELKSFAQQKAERDAARASD